MQDKCDDEIEFASGGRVRLVELNQSRTYGGLLEGLPTRDSNARHLEALSQKYPGLSIVQAVETPIEWSDDRPYPFGEPARLPAIECVARLQSVEDGIYFRTGVFAWFQSSWALPIDGTVLELFRSLAWSEVTTRQPL